MSRHRDAHASEPLPHERGPRGRLDVRLIVTIDGKRVSTHGTSPMTTALRCLALAWRAEQMEPPASREESLAMAEAFLAKLRSPT